MEPIQTPPDGEGGEVVRELAGAVAKGLRSSSLSATLGDIVSAGRWYVVLDERARQIVFDMRALYLGFLAAGLTPRKGTVGNTAQWFLDWLEPRVGGREGVARVLEQRTDMAAAGRMLGDGFSPVPSVSVGDLEGLASGYARQTVQRPEYDARHLFAAMIERRIVTELTARLFGVTLGDDDMHDLKLDLVNRTMRSPQRGNGATPGSRR